MPTDAQRRNLASAHSSEVLALNERIKELEALDTVSLVVKQMKRIALLEQQLAEARKDSERLDFMIFYSASLNHGNDGEYCRVVWRDHEFGEQATRLFGDSRQAIDAAIAGTQEQT